MLHQPHPTVSRPALLVIVPDNVLIIRVRILRQKALDQVSGLILHKPEYYIDAIYIATVQSNGVACLSFHICKTHEFVGASNRPS